MHIFIFSGQLEFNLLGFLNSLNELFFIIFASVQSLLKNLVLFTFSFFTVVIQLQNLTTKDLINKCTQKTKDWEIYWREFVKRYGEKILYFVYKEFKKINGHKYTNQPEETIKDLRQEVFIRLLENEAKALIKFKSRYEWAFLTYLNTISINVVRNFIRFKKAEKRSPELYSSGYHKNSNQVKLEPKATDTLDEMDAQFLKECLINTLKKFYKGRNIDRDIFIFKLYYFHGLSPKEIERLNSLKITASGIETLITRMKKILTNKFKF